MSFQDIFKSNFIDNVTSVSLLDMLIAMILAFGLGIFIFLVYKNTYPGVMYERRRIAESYHCIYPAQRFCSDSSDWTCFRNQIQTIIRRFAFCGKNFP